MKITLLEPQCCGLEHVPFNTSLLKTVLLAMPGAGVVFSGESTHVANVREALGDPVAAQKIRWRTGFGGIAHGDGFAGFPKLLNAGFELGRYCKNERVGVLVLCSATPPLLTAMIATRFRSTAVITVLHACLAQLLFNPITQCIRNPLSIHTVARIPVPRGMRVVVLGAPIFDNLRAMGLASAGWASIDHPFASTGFEIPPPPPQPIRFGYLAGFERSNPETRRMLERVSSSAGCEIAWIGRESAEAEALSPDEYRKRLGGVHYAIWLGDADAYRLRASATFLDAVAMGKPLIYLRNDFVDYFNSHRGPFGFPVSSVGELEELLIRLARSPLDENYNRLVRTSLAASRTFSPETIAPGLRSIIDAARDEIKDE